MKSGQILAFKEEFSTFTDFPVLAKSTASECSLANSKHLQSFANLSDQFAKA